MVETRSIGFVPRDERYGRPVNQFTLWFGTNLNITCVVTGALAVVLGGDVVWSIVGLFIGQLLGGAVMALHAVQGPRLGMPQMISSRAQFGVYGAVIPLVLVILMYIGFAASGTVLAGQAVAALVHSPQWIGILIFGIVTALIAIIGYRVIHMMGRIASVVSGLVFVYLTVRLLTGTNVGALLGNHHFSVSGFVLAISLAASWQIAYGPYVADYSRYLPISTSPGVTFGSTLAGTVIGSQWAMTFGVLAAAIAGDRFAGHEVSFVVSLGGTGLMAALLYFVIALGKLCVNVLDTYGGFMSTVTTVTGFIGHREISRTTRSTVVSAIMLVAMAIAIFASSGFVDKFSTFLLFLLTFFTPWSAVNLVDFYFISKERYDVGAIGDPQGRYGKWNAAAIGAYIIGLAAQLPFLSTSFYTGPLVSHVGDTDYSWLVGLIVPGLVYYFWSKAGNRSIPDRLILPDEDATSTGA